MKARKGIKQKLSWSLNLVTKNMSSCNVKGVNIL